MSLSFVPLPTGVREGDPRKSTLLPLMSYFPQMVFEGNGVSGIDLIYLNPGDKILPHGHKEGEAEIWHIFKGNGLCEVKVCAAGAEHQIANDSDKTWAIIGIKTTAEIAIEDQ